MAYVTSDPDTKPTANEAILEKAKKCFKLAVEAFKGQSEREVEDLKFQVGEFQWSEQAKNERQGGRLGGQVIPPRPMLSVPQLDQPKQLVLNQAREANLGVNIHPVSENATDETAQVLQGIYRRIERDSNASQARNWALDRAVLCGRGAYRVNVKWDEDSDPAYFDQEIVIERLLYQDAAYFDPAAQKPDFSDGEWAFVTAWMPLDTFRRMYPDAEYDLADSADFDNSMREEPEWVRNDGEGKAVRVAEYFYKDHAYESVKAPNGRTRKRDVVSVKRVVMTAFEVLETQDWMGKYIPLIPVVGRELQPFEAERRWVGMIRPARDAQVFANYSASTLVEAMATEPKVPVVGAEGQFEGHEDEWQQINTRNLPYVEYKPKTLNGEVMPPPARMQVDSSKMQLAANGLNVAKDWIQSITGFYDPSLGKLGREKSGRQVLALQQQADTGNNHFLASLADTTLPYEARVIMDLIPAIYDRPGRITRVLGEEDDVKAVMVNQTFKLDPATGNPVPAQEGEPGAKTYNLSEGKYTVSVSIGKSYQTRMQEGQEEIGAILQADPSLMPLIGSVYFRFRDSPGSKEIADILKEVRTKQFGPLGKDKEQGPTPEMLQAELQATKGQLQMAGQQLQMAVQKIETDQAKQQAQMYKAQLDHQAKMADLETRMNESIQKNATTIAVAQINAEAKGAQMATEARNEAIALGHEHAFEADQAELDRQHEQDQAAFNAAHAVGMGAAGGNTMNRTIEGGQDQEQEQGGETSTATLPPEPAQPTGGP